MFIVHFLADAKTRSGTADLGQRQTVLRIHRTPSGRTVFHLFHFQQTGTFRQLAAFHRSRHRTQTCQLAFRRFQYGQFFTLGTFQPNHIIRAQNQIPFLPLHQGIHSVHAARGSPPGLQTLLRQQPAAQSLLFFFIHVSRSRQCFHQQCMHRNLPVGTHKTVRRIFQMQPFCPVHQVFTQRTYQSGGGISLAHIAQYDDGLGGFGKR